MHHFRILHFLVFLGLTFAACEKDDDSMNIEPPINPEPQGEFFTGLDPNGDLSTTPISPTFAFGNGANNLPASVDLTQYFPPIGDQGNYGTCVAWAVGYNFKTAVNAIDRNETGAALADPSKQGAPKYLFTSVPDAEKGANCEGMLFEPALNVVQSKGLASMADVPYEQLGNCSQMLADPSWDTPAASNKLASYRRIDGSISAIKQSLADKQPVIIGAKLGKSFQEWRGDGVLTTSGQFDPNYRHGYHAMVIIGYDDTKGPNGAFRVVNSWNTVWGDQGYVWIDYNYFINEMMMKDNGGRAFMYTGENAKGSNPDDNQPNPPSGQGVELLTWMYDDAMDDQSQSPLDRVAEYDIYNFGTASATAAQNWDVYYIYYNAYDINDWGVLFQNQITTSVTDIECSDNGCLVNVDIPANSSMGSELFPEEGIAQDYTIPALNGDYFLMMVADAEEEVAEGDEIDNFFFPSLYPIRFNNGQPALRGNGGSTNLRSSGAVLSQNRVDRNELSSGNVGPEAPEGNAYRPDELKAFIAAAKTNGALQAKAAKSRSRSISTTAASLTH